MIEINVDQFAIYEEVMKEGLTRYCLINHYTFRTELFNSIKQYGIKEPLIVYLPNGSSKYSIINGIHRFLIAICLGLTEIPVILFKK